MALIIIIVTVAFIALIVVLILIVINRRRRATKGHISLIVTQVPIEDSVKPVIDCENYTLQTIENELPQNIAQYASEDIENAHDKARRRVYFRNVLEDAGRHELRQDQAQRLEKLEMERKERERIELESQEFEERVMQEEEALR